MPCTHSQTEFHTSISVLHVDLLVLVFNRFQPSSLCSTVDILFVLVAFHLYYEDKRKHCPYLQGVKRINTSNGLKGLSLIATDVMSVS